MAEVPRPRVYTDFDGTAIDIVGKHDWRNWLKTGIPLLPGYTDFLQGVHDGGVEISGVISRRGEMRRGTTMRAITTLGLSEHFGDPAKVILAGSERAKGQYLADQSRTSPVGMLEDKPHKLVPIVVGALMTSESQQPHYPITIGAVAGPRAPERIDQITPAIRFLGAATASTPDGLKISHGAMAVNVVPLPGYSYESGQAFAQELTAPPSA